MNSYAALDQLGCNAQSLQGLEENIAAVVSNDLSFVSFPPLQFYTDADMEAVERQRCEKLVQEGWFHQSQHFQRWDEKALLRGSSYRARAVATRTAFKTSRTTALVLNLNINPKIWRNEDCGETVGAPSLKTSCLFAWRLPVLMSGDNSSILSELGQELEDQYRSLSKRSLMVCHCLNSGPENLVRALSQCRREAGPQGKVIVHYGGYGVRRPCSGSLFLYCSGNGVGYSLATLCLQVGFPLVLVADCANAGFVLDEVLEARRREQSDGRFTYGRYGGNISSSALNDHDCRDRMMPAWDHGGDVSHTSATDRSSGAALLTDVRGLDSDATSSVSSTVFEDFFFLGATVGGSLSQHPKLPSDIFASCLTTPVRMMILWFIVENSNSVDIHPLLMDLIPGELSDKKTPLGQLQWAFVCITECIAWSSYSYFLFMRIFREDVVLASLFRGFLLAERIITALGGMVSVYPYLPRTSNHILWETLDGILDRTLVSLQRAVRPTPPATMNSLEFREWLDCKVTKWRREQNLLQQPLLEDRSVSVPGFLEEELRSFAAVVERVTEQSFLSLVNSDNQQHVGFFGSFAEVPKEIFSEEFGDVSSVALCLGDPCGMQSFTGVKSFSLMMRLPMLLQGLTVAVHRDQATELVCRLVDVGSFAVNACAEVGIFNMALKQYWGREDLHHLLPALFFIYAKACHTDPALACADTMQRDLILKTCVKHLQHPMVFKEGSSRECGMWQYEVLDLWARPKGQRVLLASLLAMICFHSDEGRRFSFEIGAFGICCELLHDAVRETPLAPVCKRETKNDDEGSVFNDGSFLDKYECGSVIMTIYVLSLIAFFVSLLSEETFYAVNLVVEEQEREQCKEDPVIVRKHLFCAIDVFQVFLSAASSAVRGASIKAITVVLLFLAEDEETALKCVHVIAKCASMHRAELEGNTENRLEFIGAVFLAIKWLLERLSGSLSQKKIRQVLIRKSLKFSHVAGGTQNCEDGAGFVGHYDDNDASLFDSTSFTSSFSFRDSSHNGIGRLLDILTVLTCRLAVATHDPCPFVAAHAQKVLADEPSLNGVQRMFFFGLSNAVSGVRASGATRFNNLGIGKIFSGVLSTLTLRGGKQTSQREACQGGDKQVARNSGHEEASSGELPDACTFVGGSLALSDVNISLRAVSLHDRSTISSFVFTLLSFLGELLLIPMDDNDPRHPFNIEKDTYLDRYMRRLHDGLRVSPQSSSHYTSSFDATDTLAFFPFSFSAPLLSHQPNVALMQPQVPESPSAPPPLVSSFINSSLAGSVDSLTLCTSKDSPVFFRLLAEKNMSCELEGRIQVLTFHPTEQHFVTGTDQGVIQVWSLEDGKEAASSYCGFLSSFFSASGGGNCRLKARIRVADVVTRPAYAMPPSAGLKHMYNAQTKIPQDAELSRMFSEKLPGNNFDFSPRRSIPFLQSDHEGCGARGTDPLTGLHLVDPAYRTLLCTVGRSGFVQLFSAYTDAATVRRVASFPTMTYEESLRSHQCLSTYHVSAMLLHVSGADGSIASWDLSCEQKISEGAGRGEFLVSPSALASHTTDVFIFAVGAGNVYLYDLRHSSGSTHILRDPSSALEASTRLQQRILGDCSPLCLHVGFSCRYPHGIVTGYGGKQGVVMMWDDRNLQQPVFHSMVTDTGVTSTSSLNSVCYMDVQHYSHALMTMSVTLDALIVDDAFSSLSEGGGVVSRAHIRLKQQPSAASFHPILPLCGVVGGRSLQLYGPEKNAMTGRQ